MNVPQRSEADADAQSQQGMDPQQQFIQVDRLDQVIIDVETKTAGLGLNVIPGADEEQRDVFVDAADALRKFIVVDFRHHDIEDDEVKMSLKEHIVCLCGAGTADRVYVVFHQIGTDDLVLFLLVVYDQDMDHDGTPPFFL